MTLFNPGNIKRAKLTPALVRAIFIEYHEEGATQGYLARKHHVSINTIGRIVRQESWQNYTGLEDQQRAIEKQLSDISPDAIVESERRLRERIENPLSPVYPPEAGNFENNFLKPRSLDDLKKKD